MPEQILLQRTVVAHTTTTATLYCERTDTVTTNITNTTTTTVKTTARTNTTTALNRTPRETKMKGRSATTTGDDDTPGLSRSSRPSCSRCSSGILSRSSRLVTYGRRLVLKYRDEPTATRLKPISCIKYHKYYILYTTLCLNEK